MLLSRWVRPGKIRSRCRLAQAVSLLIFLSPHVAWSAEAAETILTTDLGTNPALKVGQAANVVAVGLPAGVGELTCAVADSGPFRVFQANVKPGNNGGSVAVGRIEGRRANTLVTVACAYSRGGGGKSFAASAPGGATSGSAEILAFRSSVQASDATAAFLTLVATVEE